jgi:hypothetical protein
MKNASTHTISVSMNKKTKDMVSHVLQNSHKIYIFFALSLAVENKAKKLYIMIQVYKKAFKARATSLRARRAAEMT